MYVATIIILAVTNIITLFFYNELKKQEKIHIIEKLELQQKNHNLKVDNNILENRIDLLERIPNV